MKRRTGTSYFDLKKSKPIGLWGSGFARRAAALGLVNGEIMLVAGRTSVRAGGCCGHERWM